MDLFKLQKLMKDIRVSVILEFPTRYKYQKASHSRLSSERTFEWRFAGEPTVAS